VARTARHFGHARPTVYRWLGRFDRVCRETLEDRSSPEITKAEATLEGLRPALLAWETTCDSFRPHQAVGYLAPAERLALIGIDA